MKSHPITIIAIIAFSAMMMYSKCDNPAKPEEPEKPRLDAIIKDLNQESFSLSFDKPIEGAGITKTAYGAENAIAYVDPQDLICPEPVRLKQRRVPIWVIPTRVWPTCPTMVPFEKASIFTDFFSKAAPEQFGNLKAFKADNNRAVLANERFTASFAKLQTDMMDDKILSGLDDTKFLLLKEPGESLPGWNRDFYGSGDLNALVAGSGAVQKSGVNQNVPPRLRDLLQPKLKGCFDILVLQSILERLKGADPRAFGNLKVTPLAQNKNIALLQ